MIANIALTQEYLEWEWRRRIFPVKSVKGFALLNKKIRDEINNKT